MSTDMFGEAIKAFATVNGDRPLNEIIDELIDLVVKTHGDVVVAGFKRYIDSPKKESFERVLWKGEVIRNWSPVVKSASLKNWVKRNHHDAYLDGTWVVEHKYDIISEGDNFWFRGKSYGDAPTLRIN